MTEADLEAFAGFVARLDKVGRLDLLLKIGDPMYAAKKHAAGDLVIGGDGSVLWYFNGRLHREDGPAVINADGSLFWYQNGVLHNDDGPALVRPDGSKWWYRRGQSYTPINTVELTLQIDRNTE